MYGDPAGKIDHSNDKPPSERYLQIMSEGAKHYGVSPDYVSWLQNHDKTPRKTMDQMNLYDLDPNAPTMTVDDVLRGNGQDGAKMLASVNGKVLEYTP